MRELHERTDQGREHGVGADAVDDRAVELDDVGTGQDDVAQRGEARPDVVDRQPHASRAQRCERVVERGVVEDPVVLGQLEDDPVEREAGQEQRAARRHQGGRRHVHGDVARDRAQVVGGALEGEQLQRVPAPDAVGLLEADVRRTTPLGGEPAEGLRADPVAALQVDDRLEDHLGPTARHERGQPGLDLVAPGALHHLGLDDHRRGMGEHVHQRLVALAQGLVRGEAGRAERAVQRAVAEDDRHGDVRADPRQSGGRQLHGLGEVAQVGDDLRQLLVEDRLAQRRGLHLGRTLLEQEGHRRLDDLEVLGHPVEAAEERDAEAQGVLGRPQQVSDLLLGVAAIPGHATPSGTRSDRTAVLHRRPGPTSRAVAGLLVSIDGSGAGLHSA